jgi:hypothetical protein
MYFGNTSLVGAISPKRVFGKIAPERGYFCRNDAYINILLTG